MDRLTPEQRSRNMKAVKSSGSDIEKILANALWKRGLRYRKNDKRYIGKPDLTFAKYKLAIFVDSEFWHGKGWEVRKSDIKSNRKFWIQKIERNIERDKEVTLKLQAQGWTVLRFWGRDIKTKLHDCISNIEEIINDRRKNQ